MRSHRLAAVVLSAALVGLIGCGMPKEDPPRSSPPGGDRSKIDPPRQQPPGTDGSGKKDGEKKDGDTKPEGEKKADDKK
jgi:hypothetical protein